MCNLAFLGSQAQSDYAMSTSQKQVSKILGAVSAKRAESFVLDLANIPDSAFRGDRGHLRKLISGYEEVFGPIGSDLDPDTMMLISILRESLRKAWVSPDSRHRDWHLFTLRRDYQQHRVVIQNYGSHENLLKTMKPSALADGDAAYAQKRMQDSEAIDAVPPVDFIEAAVFHLQTSIAERAKYCRNSACTAHYFIAVKKWQKYCSEECAGPANRESKRQWWRDNRA
jgi:hypothetical protein